MTKYTGAPIQPDHDDAGSEIPAYVPTTAHVNQREVRARIKAKKAADKAGKQAKAIKTAAVEAAHKEHDRAQQKVDPATWDGLLGAPDFPPPPTGGDGGGGGGGGTGAPIPPKGPRKISLIGDGSPHALGALIKKDAGGYYVGAHGTLYRAHSRDPIWRDFKPELYRYLAPYDGAGYYGYSDGVKKISRTVMVSGRLFEQVHEAMLLDNSWESFFDRAPVGACFSNGWVSVADMDGEPVVMTSDHRQLSSFLFPYLPTAELARDCPRVHQFLQQSFAPAAETPEAIKDGQERIQALLEFAGLAILSAFGPPENGRAGIQEAIINLGPGANGKSVWRDLLCAIFPSAVRCNVSPQQMGDQYYRAELAGKRINLCPDISDTEVIASGELKGIISCDSDISARQIRQSPFKFTPIAGHMFNANGLPKFKDKSPGLLRRFIIILWDRTVPLASRDARLITKLTPEIPALASIMVQHGIAAFKRGYITRPKSSDLAKADWHLDSNQAAEFLDDVLEILPAGTPQREWSPTVQVYDCYKIWCEKTGHRPLNRRTLVHGILTITGGKQVNQHGSRRIAVKVPTLESDESLSSAYEAN